MNALARKLVEGKYLSWFIVLVMAVVLWWFSRPVTFNQSIEGFFPDNDPALLTYQRARTHFGSDDIVFVVYDDEQLWTIEGMKRLDSLANTLARDLPAVERVEALNRMPVPWRIDAAVSTLASGSAVERLMGIPKLIAGLSTIEGELRSLADRADEVEQLRRRVCSNPLFRQVLVDPTGRTTAVVVRLKHTPDRDAKLAISDIRERADAFGNAHPVGHVAVVGPQVLIADGFIHLERDNRTLGVTAMALMACTMLVVMRSLWWALLPLISGATAWLVTQQLLNWFHLELTLSAGPIVAQSIVLCMPAASHLAMHFRQDAEAHCDDRFAAEETLANLAEPIAWCTLTAAAGYLALLSSSVRPVVQFGTIMALCSLTAAILAFVLAPAAMRSTRRQRRGHATATVATKISRLTAWAIDKPSRTIALFFLPTLAMAVGCWRLEFESNYVHIFKSHSRVVKDYRFVEERMGGIGVVELVFDAPEKVTPDWVEKLSAVCGELAASDSQVVSHVLSLADVLRRADDESARPNDDVASSELGIKLRVLDTPVYAPILKNFWDVAGRRMRILVRIRESVAAENKQAAFESLARKLEQHLGTPVEITGLSQLMTQVTRAVTITQFQTAAWSAAAILFMLCLALRSVRLGVLAILPTAMAVTLVLGVMGWLGIRIDISTALVTSVAIGLSVDDTFHCLLRWQRERATGASEYDALCAGFAGSAPGVILSSSAVSLGFLALVFSDFVPTANFGWLMAIATFGGSLGNLVVLPACLACLRGQKGRKI